jgi:6-pyruvoyltetrahydropterin/6-carboxytetrahydropterin synthase
MRLTRRYRFSASHRLHSPHLTDEQNRQTFGKCNNPFGHGHNYSVEVSVAGPVDRRSGQVADVAELDRLVRETVVDVFDRQDLNAGVAEFSTTFVPTTENLATVIRARLLAGWPERFPRLDRIRIFETRNNIFEIEEER